jgi:glycine cleavage system H protein
MIKYTKTHEWVKVEGNIATVGISEWVQNELGNVVFIDLPEIGEQVNAGELCCVLESTKAAADIYSPLDGKIVEVNGQLKQQPGLINSHAESDGWIYKMQLENNAGLEKLLPKDIYEHFLSI